MSEKILHLAPPITHLDFYGCFFNYEKSEDVLQKGKQLLHDISSISQPTLLSLNLGYNSILWEDEARFDLLLDVLE